ncbi:MAG: DUF2207 domain-containing protein [Microthrixaceae bacterium]
MDPALRSRTRSRRYAAVAFCLLVVGAAVVAIVMKPIQSGGETSRDVASIDSYSVDMTLAADGRLKATETIVVTYPVSRRGIFRIFDTADPRRDIDHPVEGLSVTRDGAPEYYQWVESAVGTETARIGRENVPLPPGTYTYVLNWSTEGVLEPSVIGGRDDPRTTLWWWDLIGSGWQMPIGSVDATVALPAAPTSVECVIGDNTPCDPTVDGTSLRLSTGALSPFEPVTVRIGMPSSEVPPNQVPGDNLILAVIAGLLGAGLGLWGLRATHEPRPGFPVVYEPPPGVTPAVGVRVLDEKKSDDEFQATLFDLGERGVLRIAPSGEKWAIEVVGDPGGAGLSSWELLMLGQLGLRGVGDVFVVSRSKSAGKSIHEARSTVDSGAKQGTIPYLRPSAVGTLMRMLAWLALAGVLAMAGANLFAGIDFPLWLVVGVAAFAVFGSVNATDAGASSKRTEAGRDAWSRVGGFARFLGTDSSESRFDAAANLDWFPRYLPWAVALGVSEEWAQRYEAQGVAPPEVGYLYGWGYGYGYSAHSFRSFSDSFNSAITSASAAYTASQSSSRGGGGFSGGSGGGGGGGGSW